MFNHLTATRAVIESSNGLSCLWSSKQFLTDLRSGKIKRQNSSWQPIRMAGIKKEQGHLPGRQPKFFTIPGHGFFELQFGGMSTCKQKRALRMGNAGRNQPHCQIIPSGLRVAKT